MSQTSLIPCGEPSVQVHSNWPPFLHPGVTQKHPTNKIGKTSHQTGPNPQKSPLRKGTPSRCLGFVGPILEGEDVQIVSFPCHFPLNLAYHDYVRKGMVSESEHAEHR